MGLAKGLSLGGLEPPGGVSMGLAWAHGGVGSALGPGRRVQGQQKLATQKGFHSVGSNHRAGSAWAWHGRMGAWGVRWGQGGECRASKSSPRKRAFTRWARTTGRGQHGPGMGAWGRGECAGAREESAGPAKARHAKGLSLGGLEPPGGVSMGLAWAHGGVGSALGPGRRVQGQQKLATQKGFHSVGSNHRAGSAWAWHGRMGAWGVRWGQGGECRASKSSPRKRAFTRWARTTGRGQHGPGMGAWGRGECAGAREESAGPAKARHAKGLSLGGLEPPGGVSMGLAWAHGGVGSALGPGRRVQGQQKLAKQKGFHSVGSNHRPLGGSMLLLWAQHATAAPE